MRSGERNYDRVAISKTVNSSTLIVINKYSDVVLIEKLSDYL